MLAGMEGGNANKNLSSDASYAQSYDVNLTLPAQNNTESPSIWISLHHTSMVSLQKKAEWQSRLEASVKS